MIQPRSPNSFKEGKKLRVYAELNNYGWQKIGGAYHTHLVTDAALLSSGGDVLWSKDGFGDFKLASRSRFVEYMMNLSLTITDIPQGEYFVQYTINDRIRVQEARITMPFSVK
jgi:hypothetical protein